jgi:hypothetical protein
MNTGVNILQWGRYSYMGRKATEVIKKKLDKFDFVRLKSFM